MIARSFLSVFFSVFLVGFAAAHDCGGVKNYPASCGWKFFVINDTLEGQVIAFDAAAGACVWNMHAAIAIVKSGSDTVRVLLPCLDFQYQLRRGDHIQVTQPGELKQSYSLPSAHSVNGGSSRVYDTKVLRTTWGILHEKLQVHFPFTNCHHIYTNSFACKWKVFADTGTLRGKVLKFHKMNGRCGDELSAAAMVVLRNDDTVRVIVPCFNGKIRVDDNVVVEIIKEPTSDIAIPQNSDFHLKSQKKGQDIYSLDEFDETVINTVFGRIK